MPELASLCPAPIPFADFRIAMPCLDNIQLYIAPWDEVLKRAGDDAFRYIPPEEEQRAAGFSHREDRNRFLAGRILLRSLLSSKSVTTDPPPAPPDWQFGFARHGKPYLLGPQLPKQIGAGLSQTRFSLAHSGDYLALACRECSDKPGVSNELGLDIERQSRRHNLQGIAQLLFSSTEQQQLRQLEDRDAAEQYFFTLWCRCEARSKLCGRGLLAWSSEGPEGTATPSASIWEDSFRCERSGLRYFWALCRGGS